jgi:hypothetical protein
MIAANDRGLTEIDCDPRPARVGSAFSGCVELRRAASCCCCCCCCADNAWDWPVQDYALANVAAVGRIGPLQPGKPLPVHAAVVQSVVTDTLSDHYPVEVLLCDRSRPVASSSGDQARPGMAACDSAAIVARLRQREVWEGPLLCQNGVWSQAKARVVQARQNRARAAMRARGVVGMWDAPEALRKAHTVYMRSGPGESCVSACTRQGQTLVPPAANGGGGRGGGEQQQQQQQEAAAAAEEDDDYGEEEEEQDAEDVQGDDRGGQPGRRLAAATANDLARMAGMKAAADKLRAELALHSCSDSAPCQHGGSCIQIFGRSQCMCLNGWAGQRCEQRHQIAQQWQCDGDKTWAAATDCELLTAEFGCGNGCIPMPEGYPDTSDATPFWSGNSGNMLPFVCVLPPTVKPHEQAGVQHEVGFTVGTCDYSRAINNTFLGGCFNNCRAHDTLRSALGMCTANVGCGGVTYSADSTGEGSQGFQTRVSSRAHPVPVTAAGSTGVVECSWVKIRCAGGGGHTDKCSQGDPLRDGQRLCACATGAA